MSDMDVALHNSEPQGTGCFTAAVIGAVLLVSLGVLFGVLIL